MATPRSTHLQRWHQKVFCHLAHGPKEHAHEWQEAESDEHACVTRRAAVKEPQVVDVVDVVGAVPVVLHKCASASVPRGRKLGSASLSAT